MERFGCWWWCVMERYGWLMKMCDGEVWLVIDGGVWWRGMAG